ncbi:MAG: glycosyl hydrolase family 28-related protein [Fimbriimonadaceae bacterium]|nr:glycosyl hydrolase family 28-related protein [Fimbriimonadaceae bacterium]
MINVREGLPNAIPPIAGAVGDGIVNDTVAVANIIAYLSTSPDTSDRGWTIFFPSGTYLLDKVVLPSDFCLVGDAAENTTLLRSSVAHDSNFIESKEYHLDQESDRLGTRGIGLCRLTIDGSKQLEPADAFHHEIAIYGVGIQLRGLIVSCSDVTDAGPFERYFDSDRARWRPDHHNATVCPYINGWYAMFRKIA